MIYALASTTTTIFSITRPSAPSAPGQHHTSISAIITRLEESRSFPFGARAAALFPDTLVQLAGMSFVAEEDSPRGSESLASESAALVSLPLVAESAASWQPGLPSMEYIMRHKMETYPTLQDRIGKRPLHEMKTICDALYRTSASFHMDLLDKRGEWAAFAHLRGGWER